MRAIILGGAAAGNWLPLLIPIACVVLIIVGIDYAIKKVRRK